jgi:hypothetical protein
MELKSLSQRIECVKFESWSLRMFLVSLGSSSMRLGVPFIAPRQLGAVGGKQGRPSCLLSSGAPDSPVCHRTVTIDGPVPISFLFWRRRPLQLQGSWRTGHCSVHTRQSGAHRIVRCPLPTIGAGHASPADCVADRCAGDRWLTGQSGEL